MPEAQGLYDPQNEHDACGIGFVAHMKNEKSHTIVAKGLEILRNLEHRGAVGADPKAGDGCGILIQMPDEFLRAVAGEANIELPPLGSYSCAPIFLPKDPSEHAAIKAIVEEEIKERGLTCLGWRDVPVDNSMLGYSVVPSEPHHVQVFIGRGDQVSTVEDFELKLFIVRRCIELRDA
jgi:glutamate synthase (NADPH/NADH) large chain